MLSLIKRIINSSYQIVKEVLSVIYYAFTFEGEALTKSLAVGYKGLQHRDINTAVREAVVDVAHYVQEHPFRSAAISGLVLARYSVPLGFLSTTKTISRVVKENNWVRVPVNKIYPYFMDTWNHIESAFYNKYITYVPFQDTELSHVVHKKLIKWARKTKHGLQQALAYENYYDAEFFKKFLNGELTKRFQDCISAFAFLEETGTNPALQHALNEYKQLHDLMSKFQFVNQPVVKTITQKVLTPFGKLIKNLPSNKLFFGLGLCSSVIRNAVEVQQHDDGIKQKAKPKYPELLNRFGCFKNKITPSKVGHLLWLLHGSPNHGPVVANNIKNQFSLWANSEKMNFGITDVENYIKKTYTM